jgi:hypothetical protein
MAIDWLLCLAYDRAFVNRGKLGSENEVMVKTGKKSSVIDFPPFRLLYALFKLRRFRRSNRIEYVWSPHWTRHTANPNYFSNDGAQSILASLNQWIAIQWPPVKAPFPLPLSFVGLILVSISYTLSHCKYSPCIMHAYVCLKGWQGSPSQQDLNRIATANLVRWGIKGRAKSEFEIWSGGRPWKHIWLEFDFQW